MEIDQSDPANTEMFMFRSVLFTMSFHIVWLSPRGYDDRQPNPTRRYLEQKNMYKRQNAKYRMMSVGADVFAKRLNFWRSNFLI